MLPQPDLTACGPTCLHAVYNYFQDDMPLEQVIEETQRLEEGGTLAVLLGCHALRRGYRASIYTFNLQVFDPTWFRPGGRSIPEGLVLQMEAKANPKIHFATRAYLEFIERGGELHMHDLTRPLLRKYLSQRVPILTGLSATYLYGCEREIGRNCLPDDIRGSSAGHFVVLCGYDKAKRTVLVGDPLLPNPLGPDHYYSVSVDRVINAILLGVLTYDANLLIVQPM